MTPTTSPWQARTDLFSDDPFQSQLMHPSRVFASQIAVGNTLECGCATALEYLHFRKLGKEYTGLDFTERFAAYGQARGANIVLGNLLELPFPDRAFDTVYCRHVLEHVAKPDLPKALSELARVARHLLLFTFFMHPGDTEVLTFDGTFHTNTWRKDTILTPLSSFGRTSILTFSGDTSVVYMSDARLLTL